MDQRIVSKLHYVLSHDWLYGDIMFEQGEPLFFFSGHCRTSMYDSRARERRRQIEEQEALAAQLLRQVNVRPRRPLSDLISTYTLSLNLLLCQ